MAKEKTKAEATKKPQAAAKKPAAKKSGAKAKSLGKPEAKAPNSTLVQWMILNITEMTEDFVRQHDSNAALTTEDRRRLIGAGVRNYGFIEKAWDIVRENPEFVPSNFSATQFSANIQSLDDYRQLLWSLEKFQQAVNEAMLLKADASFRDALRVYNNLREQSRGRVHGAQPLFMALLRFFRRPRHPEQESTEPTIKELERDFNKLIHGKADGKIVIENEQPHLVSGTRKIVDDVHKGRTAIKETAEAEIIE